MPAIYCDWIKHPHWNHASTQDWTIQGQTDIWRIPVSSLPEYFSDVELLLQESELEKSKRYFHEKDRQRYLTARSALRILLGHYLQEAPRDIQIMEGKNHKPFVLSASGRDLHYNLSHSGDWILIGLSSEPLGIDTEKVDEQFFYEDILPKSFSDTEIQYLKTTEDARKTFYLLWTRKEALCKATSKGLDENLSAIPSMDGAHEAEATVIGSADSWKLSSFQWNHHYLGTVAYAPSIESLRFWDLSRAHDI